MSAWTIRIEAETDASAERALRQALKSLPLAEDDSAPYRLEINSEDVSDGPFEKRDGWIDWPQPDIPYHVKYRWR